MYCPKGDCEKQCKQCEDDFKGKDHWDHCEDPLNCSCEKYVHCPTCGGSGFNIKGSFGEIEECRNYQCEGGLIHRSNL